MGPTERYRLKIYDKYASCFQDAAQQHDIAIAERWGVSYDTYFRGWLPELNDEAILEAACGRGVLLHFMKRGHTNLTGVDNSPEKVQLVEQVIEIVVEGDVLSFLEDTAQACDLIVGLDIIEHL